MFRELTPEEEERLLTQEEVDALPTGTRVMIKWAWGNGPWEYEILNYHGQAMAVATHPTIDPNLANALRRPGSQ
jgi:hypothetical protein